MEAGKRHCSEPARCFEHWRAHLAHGLALKVESPEGDHMGRMEKNRKIMKGRCEGSSMDEMSDGQVRGGRKSNTSMPEHEIQGRKAHDEIVVCRSVGEWKPTRVEKRLHRGHANPLPPRLLGAPLPIAGYHHIHGRAKTLLLSSLPSIYSTPCSDFCLVLASCATDEFRCASGGLCGLDGAGSTASLAVKQRPRLAGADALSLNNSNAMPEYSWPSATHQSRWLIDL